MISIKITGVNEIVRELNRKVQDLPRTKMMVYEELAKDMVKNMKTYAHTDSGRMKNSIGKEQIGNVMYVKVTAPYAIYENRRRGVKKIRKGKRRGSGVGTTHDFATKAFVQTQRNSIVTMKKLYDRVMRRR